MKKYLVLFAVCLSLGLSSCHKNIKDTLVYAPEERSLNIMKITNEEGNNVLGQTTHGGPGGDFMQKTLGGNKKAGMSWSTVHLLDVSPDGSELAYLNRSNKQDNVMIRRSLSQGAATQRTFRDVSTFSWGSDGKLYFTDRSDGEHSQVASVDSHVGNIIRQLTSGNIDIDPVLATDGKILFFTRLDQKGGPAIWSLNVQTGALTLCANGYNPCVVPNNSNQFVCVRNNLSGNSELWLVDYIVGQETLLLGDQNTSYTNPCVSPDGRWIVCEGNSKSNVNKKNNLDIFACKLDGTSLVQMTYHSSTDCCPIFSKDGRYVYFISDRANKKEFYNVWRMNFLDIY